MNINVLICEAIHHLYLKPITKMSALDLYFEVNDTAKNINVLICEAIHHLYLKPITKMSALDLYFEVNDTAMLMK